MAFKIYDNMSVKIDNMTKYSLARFLFQNPCLTKL